MMTDPIADMLTRIQNAAQAGHEAANLPASKFKTSILKVLKDQGYIKDYQSFEVVSKKGTKVKWLRVYLKFTPEGKSVFQKLVRVSKAGCRKFDGYGTMPKVMDGLGMAVVSTCKGIMCDNECRKLKLGGEVICKVW